MIQVCVLGNGQLGRMLRQAGEPLGIKVWPVGIDMAPAQLPIEASIITAEIERWPETELTQRLAYHDAFVNRDIFPMLADRLTQKQLLDDLQLPSAPWQWLQQPEQWQALWQSGWSQAIVKQRTGGYDGNGQWRVNRDTLHTLPIECYQHCIVEQMIPFLGEVSLVGARAEDGSLVFYPLTHNRHQDGILLTSVVLPKPNATWQQQAISMLSRIMHHLNYVGVMAMECFITEQGLLINELAPRVHNSGHWTQNGASINQFELHLRAICHLPMPQPIVTRPSVMVNLIGTELDYRLIELPLVNLHWYEKNTRPGRKMGHLNISSEDPQQLSATLKQLTVVLPARYRSALRWAEQKLQG